LRNDNENLRHQAAKLAALVDHYFAAWQEASTQLARREAWAQLTTPGTSAYHHLWAPAITFEVIGSMISLALAVISLFLLFRKSKRTPVLVIAWLAWGVIFNVVDYLVSKNIPALAQQTNPGVPIEIWQSLGSAAIWIPYFLMSERVKATFVR